VQLPRLLGIITLVRSVAHTKHRSSQSEDGTADTGALYGGRAGIRRSIKSGRDLPSCFGPKASATGETSGSVAATQKASLHRDTTAKGYHKKGRTGFRRDGFSEHQVSSPVEETMSASAAGALLRPQDRGGTPARNPLHGFSTAPETTNRLWVWLVGGALSLRHAMLHVDCAPR
jgi:hypothetical protein